MAAPAVPAATVVQGDRPLRRFMGIRARPPQHRGLPLVLGPTETLTKSGRYRAMEPTRGPPRVANQVGLGRACRRPRPGLQPLSPPPVRLLPALLPSPTAWPHLCRVPAGPTSSHSLLNPSPHACPGRRDRLSASHPASGVLRGQQGNGAHEDHMTCQYRQSSYWFQLRAPRTGHGGGAPTCLLIESI